MKPILVCARGSPRSAAAYSPDARPMTLPPSSAADAAPTVVRAKPIAARMTIALRMLVPPSAPKVAHYREPMRRRQGARGRWPRGAGAPVAGAFGRNAVAALLFPQAAAARRLGRKRKGVRVGAAKRSEERRVGEEGSSTRRANTEV